MKHLSRKIFLSVFVLCLAVVAFATTTFAWFTLSTTANVNSFDLNIQNDSNLEVRATVGGVSSPSATTYAQNITISQTALANELLAPVCYNGSSKTFERLGLDATKTPTWTTKTYGKTATTAGYVEVTLEFKANKAGTVKVANIASSSTGESFTASADITLTSGAVTAGSTITTIKACNALRTSFFTSANTVYHYINHMGEGEGEYGTTEKVEEKDVTTGNAGLTYYNLVNDSEIAVDSARTVSKTLVPLTEDDTAATTHEASTATNVATLTHPADAAEDVFTGTVTVRIWIDGFDADCFNAIILGEIKMAMSFQFFPTQA
jgi:hypothetical protein